MCRSRASSPSYFSPPALAACHAPPSTPTRSLSPPIALLFLAVPLVVCRRRRPLLLQSSLPDPTPHRLLLPRPSNTRSTTVLCLCRRLFPRKRPRACEAESPSPPSQADLIVRFVRCRARKTLCLPCIFTSPLIHASFSAAAPAAAAALPSTSISRTCPRHSLCLPGRACVICRAQSSSPRFDCRFYCIYTILCRRHLIDTPRTHGNYFSSHTSQAATRF